MSYYDNTDEQDNSIELLNNPNAASIPSASEKSNQSPKKDKERHRIGSGTILSIFLVILILAMLSAYFYFFIFKGSPLIKVLNTIPLNKPVPLSNAILVIQNLSTVETPISYNLTYGIDAGAAVFYQGTNTLFTFNGTDNTFMFDNRTRSEIYLSLPKVFSEYLKSISFTMLKNQGNTYLCYNVSTGSSLPFIGSIGSSNNYSCAEFIISQSNQIKLLKSIDSNLTTYLKGINFTMTTLSLSSHIGNPCVLVTGIISGVPSTLNTAINTYLSSYKSSNINIAVSGTVNTCISTINFMPLYLNITGTVKFPYNTAQLTSPSLNTSKNNTLLISVYFTMNQKSSGKSLTLQQIISLPGPIIHTYNLTNLSSKNILSDYGNISSKSQIITTTVQPTTTIVSTTDVSTISTSSTTTILSSSSSPSSSPPPLPTPP